MNDKEINNWMNSLSNETRVEIDIIKKIWLNHEEEVKNMPLHDNLKTEEITEYLKALVTSDISRILPPPPSTPITFMPIGYYPRRMSRGKPYCLVIGWGKIEDGGVELCILTADGAKNMLKVECIIPYTTYETVIAFDPQKNKIGMIQGSLHQNTVFDSNTVEPPYLPITIHERQKFIIEHITKQEPIVKLAEADKHLSQLTIPPFRDITDLRVIQVVIAEVRKGKMRNGKEWCVLEVIDGSFLPKLEHKAFNVWCDPALILKTGLEKGSYVKIIGTIEIDCMEKYPQMTACSIIPETDIISLTTFEDGLFGEIDYK